MRRRQAIKQGIGGIAAMTFSGAMAGPLRALGDEQELVVATRDGVPIGEPASRHGRSFFERTGIAVRVVQTAFDRLYDDIMVGFITGQNAYDVLIVPAGWLSDLAPYLAPLPANMTSSEAFNDIHPAYRDSLMKWQDAWIAMTVDGDLHIGAYRTDLFEDSRNRHDFAEAFGYPLAPPTTWDQYRDIAEYFSDQAVGGGNLVGTLEALSPGGQRVWMLFSRAAAYTSHPGRPGGMFFDPDTMTPSIADPGWVRALTDYVAVRPYASADAEQLGSFEARTRFVAGDAAMIIDWSDTGVLSNDPDLSSVAGRVGFFVLPGSDTVWNTERRTWEHLGRVRRVPFLAFGGWVAAVPKDRRNIDAAWRYVAWYGSPANSARDVTNGASGINPYRRSHLSDRELWRRAFASERVAGAYVDVIRESLESADLARDLRIPGFRAYAASLDGAIGRAMAGKTAPAEALADAAKDWQRITDRLGRSGQRRHYRQAMGLPV